MNRRTLLALMLTASVAPRATCADDPELATLKGHAAAPTHVAFFPDGKTVFSCGDGTLRTWDTGSGKERAVLATGRGHVNVFKMSADGVLAVALEKDRKGEVVMWTADGKERAFLPPEKHPPTALAFAPDGKRIAVGDSAGGVKIYAVEDGKELAECVGHANRVHGSAFAFSPDGKLLVSPSDDRTLRVWDAATGKRKFTLTDTGWIQDARFVGDKLFYLDSYHAGPYFQKCLDLGTGKVVATNDAPTNGGGPSGLGLVLGGKVVLAAAYRDNGNVTAWETDAAKSAKVRDTLSAGIFHVLPGRDDTIISVYGLQLVASQVVRDEGEIRVKRLRVVQEHTAQISDLCVSADGMLAATADKKGIIKIWDVKKLTTPE